MDKLRLIIDKIKKWGLFIFLISFGYLSSEVYHHIKDGKIARPKKFRTIREISAAINGNGEIILIDHANGEYEIYQDSLSRSIFELYATMMQSRYESNSK